MPTIGRALPSLRSVTSQSRRLHTLLADTPRTELPAAFHSGGQLSIRQAPRTAIQEIGNDRFKWRPLLDLAPTLEPFTPWARRVVAHGEQRALSSLTAFRLAGQIHVMLKPSVEDRHSRCNGLLLQYGLRRIVTSRSVPVPPQAPAESWAGAKLLIHES
ncbi:hypothetical protein G6O67_005992 [Ophiocordyceps sinensis]|uniref:Uncharacterized protein n=1 Tax=Ophiocordyceps sinensis TaxID=72228 RepID=A0A8H4LYJ5_9HYPO|nr:hypothetical protein G6O67_005992 [Ophiocordyceps sinensis]